MIIYTTQQAANAVLDEITKVQDLPLYQVDAYFAEYSEEEANPEFTLDEIIDVLRIALSSGLVYFSPSYLESPSEDETKMDIERLQNKIWHGDIERILHGIRHQWEHWAYIDQGAFISKESIDRQNQTHFAKFSENKYIFIEPTDADLYRSANKNW